MKTWYYIYEHRFGHELLVIEAECEPDEQDLVDAYPETGFELDRDDEWLTGPIAMPTPRRIERPAALSTETQEGHDGSGA